MARPKSDDKRQAILKAAAVAIGEQGLGAQTARISRLAGVADGTLFTYFASKDDLFRRLYVELKSGAREDFLADYPSEAPARDRARHIWNRYIEIALARPVEHRALAQLQVSSVIDEQTRLEGATGFEDVCETLQGVDGDGPLGALRPDFAVALMLSMAEAVIGFARTVSEESEAYRDAAFDVFWRGLEATRARD